MIDRKFRKTAEQKSNEAGGGVWFRNSDNLQVYVIVFFYPKLRRTITEGDKVRAITLKELEDNYHRLKL